MTARMVNAIPKANANLAGFGATSAPSSPQIAMSQDFRGESGELCELLHTSLVVQKMHLRTRRWVHNRKSAIAARGGTMQFIGIGALVLGFALLWFGMPNKIGENPRFLRNGLMRWCIRQWC
jgi:hypothetical protein